MTKMSEENKKDTAVKAVETHKNEELVSATPIIEKTPKKRIKKEAEAPKSDVLVKTTSVMV